MSFGSPTGPPASPKQVAYLLALVQKAGFEGFRDARRTLGLTQRQAGGKFTSREASALIDQLCDTATGEIPLAPPDPLAAERAFLVRGLPADLLVAELERRGYAVTAPADGDSARTASQWSNGASGSIASDDVVTPLSK
jgi:hypothetical protein